MRLFSSVLILTTSKNVARGTSKRRHICNVFYKFLKWFWVISCRSFFYGHTTPRHNQCNVRTLFYYINISVNSWFVLINLMNTGQIRRGTRPIIGFGWAAEGLKPWPFLGEKNPKIHTLFTTTTSILLPCLGQRKRTKCTPFSFKAIYWQLQ